tara:strand:- start:182 stop:655 length:474 start_codon:yes stop_codon:yes gene_type:complete
MARNQPENFPPLINGRAPEQIKPVMWEMVDAQGASAGVAGQKQVRVFRLATASSTYDVQITKRIFYPKRFDHKDPKASMAYTLTLWGWSHTDGVYHSPSVGRSYRWKDMDHLRGPDFAHKMGLSYTDANALLKLLQDCRHSVSLCEVIDMEDEDGND